MNLPSVDERMEEMVAAHKRCADEAREAGFEDRARWHDEERRQWERIRAVAL